MKISARGLAAAALACHALLIGVFGVTLARGLARGSFGSLAWIAAALPLIAAWPGLRRRNRTAEQWTAFLLVLYAGAASVEVVASAGGAPLAAIALFAALAELGILFALSRAPQLPLRADRE